MHDAKKNIQDMKSLISHGGGSSQWFAQAFLSWFSHDTNHYVDLSGVGSLDNRNFELLIKMLRLRRDRQLTESDVESLIDLRELTLKRCDQ